MQSICIDRMEETIAVCQDESGGRLDIPQSLLPGGAREGDWLLFDGTACLPDPERTEKERAAAANLFRGLKKRRRSDG